MSVLFDTGIVYAHYARSDDSHARACKLIQGQQQGVILPARVNFRKTTTYSVTV
jgi:predicted nucleic acid-binding protein